MSILEGLRSWAWIPVLAVSLLIGLLTLRTMKMKPLASIGFALLRIVIFFALMYPALVDQPRLSEGIALPVAGLVLLAFGLFLIIWGSRKLTTTRLEGVKGLPEKLITSGPYAVIRHPINLGLMLAFTGWYLVWGGTWSLILPAVLVVVLILETFWEERNIVKAMGKEYEEYKRRVGMFFPRLRKR